MKKKFLTFCFFFFTVIAFAEENKFLLEAKGGMFFPLGNTFKETDHNIGMMVEGELNYRFWKGLAVWGSGSYYWSQGKEVEVKNNITTKTNDNIKTHLFSFGLGLKYFYNLNKSFDIYLGAGAFYFLRISEESTVLPYTIKEKGFGYIVKAGSLYKLNNKWVIDLFLEYANSRHKEPDHNIKDLGFTFAVKGRKYDLQSIAIGIGLGRRF